MAGALGIGVRRGGGAAAPVSWAAVSAGVLGSGHRPSGCVARPVWGAAAAAWSSLLLCWTHAYLPALAPLAPVPLLQALALSGRRRGFYLGLGCGMGEAAVLAGMCHVGWQIWLFLVLFYGLGRALFACFWQRLGAASGGWGAATGGALWLAVERLQAAVPLSLPTLLGDTQHTGPWLPLARLGGTYWVSGALVWTAGVIRLWFAAAAEPGKRAAGWGGEGSAGVWPWRATGALALALAVARLAAWADAAIGAAGVGAAGGPTATVRLVQGGLPSWLYDRARSEPSWAGLPESVYDHLTRSGPAVDLTIWPETAVNGWWGSDRALMGRLHDLSAVRGALLVGLPRRDAAGAAFNSAIWLPKGTGTAMVWDKSRLALGAEAGFTPGELAVPWSWQGGSLGLIFCLESVVPERARVLAAAGAGVLVVLAEGGRLGGTLVGRLHAQRSVVRAVETGRSVLHVGQHGFTQIIAADGSRTAPLPPFVAATQVGRVALAAAPSMYVKMGDWMLGVWLAIGLRGASVRRRAP